MDTLFRIATSEVEIEIEGSEEFVRREMERFLRRLDGAAIPAAARTTGGGLKPWYDRHVARDHPPSMQDSVLVFGYYLKRETNRHMFTPGDMKRAFTEVGRTIPKSLLQIMGTLKRDQELLWSPGDKRGMYALSPRGIRHVEERLGIARPKAGETAPSPDATTAPARTDGEKREPTPGTERWSELFRPETRRES